MYDLSEFVARTRSMVFTVLLATTTDLLIDMSRPDTCGLNFFLVCCGACYFQHIKNMISNSTCYELVSYSCVTHYISLFENWERLGTHRVHRFQDLCTLQPACTFVHTGCRVHP